MMPRIFLALLLLLGTSPAFAWQPMGGGYSPPSANNLLYPLPLNPNAGTGYTCSTNVYVNSSASPVSSNLGTFSAGSNSNNGTSLTTPFATIAKATTGSNLFVAGACVNLAPGTYSEEVTLLNSAHGAGSTNSLTGYAVLRCANEANPWLYYLTSGAQGSQPACKVNGVGGDPPGGIIGASDGTAGHVASYSIVDSIEVVSQETATVSVSALSYVSGTGLVTVTLSTTPTRGNSPYRCFTMSGLVGTGSIASANGYFCALVGTNTTTTVVYAIPTGLTLAYTSGGTFTYNAGSQEVGIGNGPNQLDPGAHHIGVFNCLIHDIGGAGINSGYSDYIMWQGNVVYNTSWYGQYDDSGIGMVVNVDATFTAGPLDGLFGTNPIDGTAIHNIVANNISYNNGNLFSPQTDGEGIIIDTLAGNSTNCTTSGEVYTYSTLVYGNLVYNNGGKGIHVYRSNHVLVVNNTGYNNSNSIISYEFPGTTISCSSNSMQANNISWNIVSNTFIYLEYLSAAADANGSANNLQTEWNKNYFYITNPPANCNGSTSQNSGTVCYNGVSAILSSAPAAWASGTTYGAGADVTGSDGNVYVSLAGSNVGNQPVGGAGAHWNLVGTQGNTFTTQPVFVNSAIQSPNLQLGPSSTWLGTSPATVTGFGGYTVQTPNPGFY
jgi:hypothetical protein